MFYKKKIRIIHFEPVIRTNFMRASLIPAYIDKIAVNFTSIFILIDNFIGRG